MVDPIMSDQLTQLMLRLKRDLQLTSIVVTHDLDLMYKVADRVVFLFEGRVIYFGPVADLEKSDHPHIREFLELDRVVLHRLVEDLDRDPTLERLVERAVDRRHPSRADALLEPVAAA